MAAPSRRLCGGYAVRGLLSIWGDPCDSPPPHFALGAALARWPSPRAEARRIRGGASRAAPARQRARFGGGAQSGVAVGLRNRGRGVTGIKCRSRQPPLARRSPSARLRLEGRSWAALKEGAARSRARLGCSVIGVLHARTQVGTSRRFLAALRPCAPPCARSARPGGWADACTPALSRLTTAGRLIWPNSDCVLARGAVLSAPCASRLLRRPRQKCQPWLYQLCDLPVRHRLVLRRHVA
jgi:hypothetical protein